MKYYRVKREWDCVKEGDLYLVRNELFTKRELAKHGIGEYCVTEVEVRPKDTYFMFGARFCKQQGYSN